MAHIQLINLTEKKSPDGKAWKFAYAIPILVRQLLNTSHTFSILDTHLDKLDLQELTERAIATNAGVFGISAYSHNYLMVKHLSEAIRRAVPDATIVVGGLLAQNYEVLLTHTEVDVAVTSPDGEFILVDLLDALDQGKALQQVQGLAAKDRRSGKTIQTASRPGMTNEAYQHMDMPAYEHPYFDNALREIAVNINSRADVPVRAFPLLTMRGCPFRCTFCGHLYGHGFLKKAWDRFFDEALFLQERYGFEGFYSYDTNMFFSEKDVDAYCSEYEMRGATFKMLVELRPTFGDTDMFKKLREHGVRVVLFGLESGSQHMLDRMKKGFHLPTMKQVLKSCVDAGLLIHGNFIFGTPGESPSTVKETRSFMLYLEKLIHEQKISFARRGTICTSGYGRSFLVLSPTSELYDVARGKGLIEDEETYLRQLCDKKAFDLVPGSKFKIALAEMGGNVNMSMFTSREALIAFVDWTFAVVKLRTLFLGGPRPVLKSAQVLSLILSCVRTYLSYLGTRSSDAICGRRAHHF